MANAAKTSRKPADRTPHLVQRLFQAGATQVAVLVGRARSHPICIHCGCILRDAESIRDGTCPTCFEWQERENADTVHPM